MCIARHRPSSSLRRASAIPLLALALGGCAVGPNFTAPTPQAPPDWTAWRSGDESLRPLIAAGDSLPAEWWRAFGDPVLDRLQQQAVAASLDLRTAAARFAQARAQRLVAVAAGGPQVNLNAGANRLRQSETGAATRPLRAIAGQEAQPLIDLVSQPFTLYQVGFDAAWEPDFWGRVARTVEAADADVSRQSALLDLARLSLASEVAQNYFELRSAQRLAALLRADASALQERVGLQQARVRAGVQDHLDLERRSAELAGVQAQLPPLLAQEAASAARIALLLGEHPGALQDELRATTTTTAAQSLASLPDLALGLPSEVAQRRPDIRAAEARLHSATASIGVARADLYPSIRIGAQFGFESYQGSALTEWASRTWSIGPRLDLPLFDRGRRKAVMQLRELQQQEAAIAYQRTVLQAWQEIDTALAAYAAERLQEHALDARARHAGLAWELVQAHYKAGTIDFTSVIDAERAYLQSRRELVASQGRLQTRFVAVNRAVGN